MANQIIRPDDLPPRANPVASEIVPSDNGSTVAGVTWTDGVNAGRPLASQNEAEAGVNATKAMTPLTTKQAIEAQAITGLTAGENVTISGPANNPVIDATAELNSGDKGDVSVITPTSEWRINRRFDTVADFLADDGTGPTGMGYAGSGAPVTVVPGDIITAQGFRYEVAASGATDHDLTTSGGVKLRVLETQTGPKSVKAYAAVSTTSQDNTASINYALQTSENSEVVIPPGTWRVDGMIEVGANRTLSLAGGAVLRKYAATADNVVDPVVWIKGSRAVVQGLGSSTIKADVRTPSGIVRFGHKDMTESPVNITFSKLRGLKLEGEKVHGQVSGLPDKGLWMPSPQFNDLVNYFHHISDLEVWSVNVGVHLEGWANGLMLNNIIGYAIGNQSLSGDRECAFFVNDGALDNTVTNIALHYSANTPGLVVLDRDNSGNGGSFHESAYNSFRGVVLEQGGSTARSLVSRSGRASFYEIRDNTALGPSLHNEFYETNTFFTATGITSLNLGRSSQRTYTGTGTQSITVKFRQNLTGASWNNGVVELVFSGITGGATNEQVSRYAIPVKGVSSWLIGSPIKVYGGDLTITQTGSGSNFVTFTVEGSSPSQKVSILAVGIAQSGIAFL